MHEGYCCSILGLHEVNAGATHEFLVLATANRTEAPVAYVLEIK